jgi:hypothetical protein
MVRSSLGAIFFSIDQPFCRFGLALQAELRTMRALRQRARFDAHRAEPHGEKPRAMDRRPAAAAFDPVTALQRTSDDGISERNLARL